MAALTAPRRISNLVSGLLITLDHPVAANAVLYKGAMVGLNASGYLVPASTTSTVKPAGVVDTGSDEKIDNTGGANGDKVAKVQLGIFPFKNGSAGDAIAQADVRNVCYVLDDQTVGKTDGGASRPKAGTIVRVDGSGATATIWVAMGVLTFA